MDSASFSAVEKCPLIPALSTLSSSWDNFLLHKKLIGQFTKVFLAFGIWHKTTSYNPTMIGTKGGK